MPSWNRVCYDDFHNDVPGVSLEAHTPIQGSSWDNIIGNWGSSGEHCRIFESGSVNYFTLNLTTLSNDQAVEVKMYDISVGGAGLLLRASASGSNISGYLFYFNSGSSGAIYRMDSGSYTELSPLSWSADSTAIMRMEVVGNTITVYKNYSVLIQVTDSTYTSGKAGLMCNPVGYANWEFFTTFWSYSLATPIAWIEKFHDTFTDTDGTLLTAHTPELGAGWAADVGTWKIQSNQCRLETLVIDSFARPLVSLDSVQAAQFKLIPASLSHYIAALVRSSGSTGYLMWAGCTINSLNIFRMDGPGSYTSIAAISYIYGGTETIRVEANGNTITGFINGVQAIQVVDSTYTTGGISLYTHIPGASASNVITEYWGYDTIPLVTGEKSYAYIDQIVGYNQ